MKWLFPLGFAVCLFIGATAQAASTANADSCRLGCDQALAECERALGMLGNCSLRREGCSAQCDSTPKQDRRTPLERRHAICEQQCDLNRTLCERSNPDSSTQCMTSRQGCVERCG
jgi:hypothetical protein